MADSRGVRSICRACGGVFRSRKLLSAHYRQKHKMTKEELKAARIRGVITRRNRLLGEMS